MLKVIPNEEYDVTVFVMAKGGDLFNNIPDWVKVKCIYGEYNSTSEKVKESIENKDLVKSFKQIYYTLLSKAYRKLDNIYKEELCQLKIVPEIKEEYDIAIAYHVPASLPVVYVINNLNAKSKLAWIHSDISVYEEELVRYGKYYPQFDKIYCVSEFARNKFIEKYPDLKNKVEVFYNIIDKKELNKMAEEYRVFEDDFKGTRLLTVGRLTEQKGQDLIPQIINKALKDNLNIRWYLIGDGEEKENLEKEIKDNNLQDRIILLGTKINPYPYFKECDIYVQPSRHEGYCITLAEARAFNKPIVTTDFVGAMEQIIDGKTGIIVKFDKHEIYNAIKKISQDNKFKSMIINNSKHSKYLEYNTDSLEKLFE